MKLRPRRFLVGLVVVGLCLVITSPARSGVAPACSTASYTFAAPLHLKPTSHVLADGTVLVEQPDTPHEHVRVYGPTGSLRRTDDLVGAGDNLAGLVLDPHAVGAGGHRQLFALSVDADVTGCQHLVTQSFQPVDGRQAFERTLPGFSVLADQQLIGAASGVMSDGMTYAAVELRTGPGQIEHVYFADYPYRDASAAAHRGWVRLVSARTGGEALALEVPMAVGPGPISGFHQVGKTSTFVAMLGSEPGGTRTTVKAFDPRGQLWSSIVDTLPSAGTFLDLRTGPAFVTSQLVGAAGVAGNASADRVSVLDAHSGKLLWQLDLTASLSRHFSALGGDLLVDDLETDQLTRYDAATGHVRWRLQYAQAFQHPHFLLGSAYVLTDAVPTPLIINGETGAETPRPEFTGLVQPVADLDGDGQPDVVQLSSGMATAISAATGRTLWSTPLLGSSGTPFASSGGEGRAASIAITWSQNFTLYAVQVLDARTGATRWSHAF